MHRRASTGRTADPRFRALPVAVALSTLGLLAAACGGSPPSAGVANLGAGSSTTTPSPGAGSPAPSASSAPTEAELLKLSECMRAHGLADFPDPSAQPGGGFGIDISAGKNSDLDPQSSQFKAARAACQKDIPPGLAQTPAQMAANALKYSECMRNHGEPDFPEPNSQGLIALTNPTGILDPSSPQFLRAQQACESLDHGFDEAEAVRSGSPGARPGPAGAGAGGAGAGGAGSGDAGASGGHSGP
ncbi:MAG TPA: hypothetical protein VMD59_00180 [Acidimicrobiales bacterium]|nr:hypothetical protein [Acidimicrobiales bacterium]